MPSLTLTFTAPLNTSCQVGDTAYYVDTVSDGGFTTNSTTNSVIEIGQIREITNPTSNAPTVICDTMLPGTLHNQVKFILFSKDNKANLSSILGYYADVKFSTDSTTEAELFSIGMEIFESSK
tara:strand:+ start:491 stop:859 length:369 start_codon:yes stop_codon:yes gene_type:complete